MLDTNQLFNLFQFVALAIPAIAILMQVVITLHESKSDSEGERPAGFMAMELSLCFLLLGGLLVGSKLYENIQSARLQLGVSFILLSLPLLGFAIIFSTRTAAHWAIVDLFISRLIEVRAIKMSQRGLNSANFSVKVFWLTIIAMIEFILSSAMASAIVAFILIIENVIGLNVFLGDLNPLILIASFSVVIFAQSYGFLRG